MSEEVLQFSDYLSFLFMAKVYYYIVLLLQYSCNQWIIKHFSVSIS